MVSLSTSSAGHVLQAVITSEIKPRLHEFPVLTFCSVFLIRICKILRMTRVDMEMRDPGSLAGYPLDLAKYLMQITWHVIHLIFYKIQNWKLSRISTIKPVSVPPLHMLEDTVLRLYLDNKKLFYDDCYLRGILPIMAYTVYKRVGISQVEVYKRVRKSVI